MKYTLPKPYLSHSQMQLWLKDREAYKQRYYLNGPSFENAETIFGKKIAKMLEDGVKDPVLDRVPRYKSMEHRIEILVGDVPFLGVMDSFSPHFKRIIEYKTGKIPWDDVRVRKHDQLIVYSLLSKLKYGKVDPWLRLVWMETRYKIETQMIGSRQMEGESNELEFTGKIEVFWRRVAEWERKKMRETIQKVAEEISEDYSKFIKTL